jgi:hypothetical protein
MLLREERYENPLHVRKYKLSIDQHLERKIR